MATEERVREEAKKILSEANLDDTSGRTIKTLIGQSLELSREQLKAFRVVIEEEIAAFLQDQQHDPLPATPSSTQQTGEKRSPSASATLNRPAKQRKTEDDTPGQFALSDSRKVVVREFKGKQLVDIREFYEKDGEQKPGSKGLALSVEQWQTLARSIAELSKAVEEEEVGYSVDLGSNRLASVSSYKGGLNVDLREHYEKDGSLAPGKKGIALTLEQWQTLCGFASDITAAAGSSTASEALDIYHITAVHSTDDVKELFDSEGDEPKAGGSSEKQKPIGSPAGEDGEFVDLGKLRRASVSEFKGKKLLNIREYYEKDGEMKPGKKGISLTNEQAEKLLQNLDGLTEALEQQHETSVLLGSKRHAKVNKFKNAYLLDIREYYEKDGEEKPGLKGISLTQEQWATLAANLSRLISSL